jgi:ATP-binding cassette subfamily F protein 3
MISLNHVSKFYGKQDLLRDVSLSIHPGERIALVGVNGAGKTTLLKILLGELEPDSGQVHRKKGSRLGYLPQDVVEFRGKTVLRQVMEVDSGIKKALAEYQTVSRSLEKSKDHQQTIALANRQSHLQEELERLGAYDLESRAKRVLAGLGFKEESFQSPIETLSGGWIMRVALARLLLSQPDLLLLDEPTNHLDLDSLLWLENFLTNTSSALLLISHDRAFMDRVVQKTFELEKAAITSFPGNYSTYMAEKGKRLLLQEAAHQNQQEKIRQIEDFVARNRTRKDRAKQVQSRIKMLNQMVKIPSPVSQQKISFHFPEPERSGRVALELQGIGKSYGSQTLYQDLDLTISRGDGVAILGPNGAGKTTLLKIMAGIVQPDSGRRQVGHKISLGFFAQHQLDQLQGEHTVWQEAASVAGDRTYGTLRNLLAAFLFREEDIEKKVSVLSGGEKSRLVILMMLLSGANFLLFDEPTNHLDIPSRDVLEEALRSFSGTLALITHDRHLINRLANKIIYIRDGKLDLFPGNYSDFEEIWKSRLALEKGNGTDRFPEKTSTPEAKTGSRKSQEEKRLEAERRNALFRLKTPLKKEIQGLELKLTELTEEKARTEQALADPVTYQGGTSIQTLTQAYGQIQKEIEALNARWEEAALELETLESRFLESPEESLPL